MKEVLRHLRRLALKAAAQAKGTEAGAKLGAGDLPDLAACFDRPAEAMAFRPPPEAERPALRRAAEEAAAKVLAAQSSYQPLYGLDPAQKSPRESLLRASVDLVHAEFAAVGSKAQLRILDVGCNAGFVSFALSETFPNVVGLDVSAENIALCQALKAHSGSPAQFFQADLMDLAQRRVSGLEGIDCLLLLNVVHQLIFARGMDYVKTLLGRLSQQVDFILVELARPEEYRPHGKDHLLPLDPAEILSACSQATITQISDQPRPVYTIRRRSHRVAGREFHHSQIAFSDHANPQVMRKYYFGSNAFTKVIRFNSLQGPQTFRAEVAGLRALKGAGIAPGLLAAEQTPLSGKITIERLYGPSLLAELPRLTPKEKAQMLRQVIHIAATLAARNLCQNDFSGHNFMRVAADRLKMVDFEMSGPAFLRDPYAMLLWIAQDLLDGRASSYREVNPRRLLLPEAPGGGLAPRADFSAYPKLDLAALRATFGSDMADILRQMRETDQTWSQFIQSAWQRLS